MSTAEPPISPRSFLHILLTVFIGLLVAGFVGLGIAAFYPAPKSPDYPIELRMPAPGGADQSAEQKQVEEEYKKAQDGYREDSARYSRVVSSVAVVAAIIILVLSLTLLQKILIIADGLLLGGIFTLVYSIIRALPSGDARFQFIVVTVGLVVTLALSYIKFVKPADEKE